MAASGKGKERVEYKESSEAHISEKKRYGSSSSNTNPGEDLTEEITNGSNESGDEGLPAINPSPDEEMKLVLMLHEKIVHFYRRVIIKLVDLGYNIDVAKRSVLNNGCFFGEGNIFSNVVATSIETIKSGNATTHDGAKNLSQLAMFAMEMMIHLFSEKYPKMERAQVVVSLLASRSLEIPEYSTGGSDHHQEICDDTLAFLKSFTNCPDGVNFGDWLMTFSDDCKDELIFDLSKEVENTRVQAEKTKEWAQSRVIKTAKRFNKDRNELWNLRFDKEKENSEDHKSRVNEKLHRAEMELQALNQHVGKLNVEHEEIEAAIATHMLNASECEKAVLQARKMERKHLQIADRTEKDIAVLKRQIKEENRNLEEMKEQLKNLNEMENQAELRLKHAREAKEHAHALLLEEKRLNELEEKNSQNRLADLQVELSQLKAQVSSAADASSSSPASASSNEAQRRRFRRCVICRNNDVDIVFLPCAHQVLCAECNIEIFEAFENQCPFCKAPIEKRVKVYGPSA